MADSSDEITQKILNTIADLTPEEGTEVLRSNMSDKDWYDWLQASRDKTAEKIASQAGVRDALEKSQIASARSGFKDWASGAPTTQEQTRSLYERLAKEAAKDDVVKNVNIGLNKAMRESELARLSSKFEGLASAEQKLARQTALRSFLGKSASLAGKALGVAGFISGLYGDDISPEEQETNELARLKEKQENEETARFKRLLALQGQK